MLGQATAGDWRQYVRKLTREELTEVHTKAKIARKNGCAMVKEFETICEECEREKEARYDGLVTMLAMTQQECHRLTCELGKAKAQQRMETLKTYSPKRHDQYAD